eukprot:TRINITY_DN135091_c3_g1_i1.p1 TRINITY_DN135091_c3_g1~~TRINITY_DN135091_c3_g1_i1.p1  ORF type:complete len:508 (-),score=40.44 TRINITY_DN135091_c3_g1_i1:1141-2664(-)
MSNTGQERVTAIVGFVRPKAFPLGPPLTRPATVNPAVEKRYLTGTTTASQYKRKPAFGAIENPKLARPATRCQPKPYPTIYRGRQQSIPRNNPELNYIHKTLEDKENRVATALNPTNKLLIHKTQNLWMRKSSVKTRMLPYLEKSVVEKKPIPTQIEYEVGKQIGQGAYAVVKEATHKKTLVKYAIKVYEKYRLLDPQRKRSVNREISVLRKLMHPNIVQLHETIDTPKQLLLVLELIKGRSMYSYLKSREGRKLKEDEARSLLKQVVSGISYCHQHNVSHRDIKMENLLLEEGGKVKIIDFGFAACVPANEKLKVFCGTPSYMAPEIVNKQEYLGPPADIWSIGVLMYALLCGTYPFKAESERELYKKIARGVYTFPPHISMNARDLIRKLLQMDPRKRPTGEEVEKDKFFNPNYVEKIDGTEEYKELAAKYGKDIIDKIVYIYRKPNNRQNTDSRLNTYRHRQRKLEVKYRSFTRGSRKTQSFLWHRNRRVLIYKKCLQCLKAHQ